MGASLVLDIMALFVGLGLRYWINRRRFYRRSPTGAEDFSSYEKSVVIKTSVRYRLVSNHCLLSWLPCNHAR